MWTSRLFWKFLSIHAGVCVVLMLLTVWIASAGTPNGQLASSVVAGRLLGCLVIALVLSASGTVLTLRLVDGSIERLTVAARRSVESGVPDLVNVKRRDELGRLEDAFNRMQRAVAERLTRASTETRRLTSALDCMVEGVVVVSQEELILVANNASRRLLDFPVVDPLGRPLLETTRYRPVHEALRGTLSSRSPQQGEFETTGKPRRALSLRTARLPGDPCPGAMVVLHDVTELRRLENLRREFVANVSHELKTPLAAIKAYAETLRLGAIDDTRNNLMFVQRIEEQAERLHQLILDLLRIARVESGQQAFDMRDIELGGIVRSRVVEFDEAAAARQIDLRLEPCRQELLVHADEEGLRQIIDNLIDNALKYTPQQGTVVVAWSQHDGMARLEVRDTGVGIAAEDQTRIFERFFRVDKARSRDVGGTGLGLAIVKHLVQAFAGRVSVESQPGAGSAFRVELPLRN